MKIAIDIRAAGGERAGKGNYAFNIVRNLLLKDSRNDYILYAREGVAGFSEFKNAKLKLIGGNGLLWHHRVASDIKRELCDVFFAPTSYIIPSLLPSSIKTVITVHDLVAFLFPSRHQKKAVLIEKLFLRRAIKHATKILAVSENTRQDILKKFKTDPEKISVVPCGVGPEFHPLKKESLLPFAKKTNLPEKFFLAVGTIEPRKNYLNLIKAFSLIAESFPNYHLIIVGQNGWQHEEVYQAIRNNYLMNRVHVLGYLSNPSLINLYSLAKALVFPSLYEGFGLPPLEAMACGSPIIVSNTSSLPEVVGPAGLFVDPKNPHQIASAMIRVIKDEELCENLKNQGILRARKFSWESSAQKLLEILNKL